MTITRKGAIGSAVAITLAIAATFEGTRYYAYKDVVGVPTVCMGYTGTDIIWGKEYTKEQCNELLGKEVSAAIDAVEKCHPGLPPNVLAAFGDAVYNIGPRVACSSTASKYLDSGELSKACTELLKWDKANVNGKPTTLAGLTRRRQCEYALCVDAKAIENRSWINHCKIPEATYAEYTFADPK